MLTFWSHWTIYSDLKGLELQVYMTNCLKKNKPNYNSVHFNLFYYDLALEVGGFDVLTQR